MAISNNLVVWGSQPSEWTSTAFAQTEGNANGFSAGSLIYAQQVNRAFRNATVLQWGLAQVLASYVNAKSSTAFTFSIGFSDVAPTGAAMSSFASALHSVIMFYGRSYIVPLRADSAGAADAFSTERTINLTGAVYGSGSGTGSEGWSFSLDISDSAVTADKISDGAVTEAKVSDKAITSDKIAAFAVRGGSTSTGSEYGHIDRGTITAWNIADSTITSTEIATSAITVTKISAGAVTTGKISDGAVTNSKLENSFFTVKNGAYSASIALGASTLARTIFGFDASSGVGYVRFNGGTLAFDVDTDTAGDMNSVVPNNFMSEMSWYLRAEFPKASIIGNYAFCNCYNLSHASLPRAEVIGRSAFYGCSSLTAISLPLARFVSEGAFAGASKLSFVDAPMLSHISYGQYGNAFSSTGSAVNGFTLVTSASEISGTLSGTFISRFVAKNLESIPQSFFYNCSKLFAFGLSTEAAVPQKTLDKVREIGPDAFKSCGALVSIRLPECSSMGNGAFNGCSNLKSVDVTSSFKVVPESCFANCSSLEYVPNVQNITSIGSYAFGGCNSVFLRGSETSNYLRDCVTIEQRAFLSCTYITELYAPALENLSGYAFSGCTRLFYALLPKVKSVGENCFAGCTELYYFSVGASCASIGNNCLYGCTDLQMVYLGESCSTIGASAFYNCPNMSVLSLSFQGGVVSLPGGSATFYGTKIYSGAGSIYVKTLGLKNFYLSAPGWSNLSNISNMLVIG